MSFYIKKWVFLWCDYSTNCRSGKCHFFDNNSINQNYFMWNNTITTESTVHQEYLCQKYIPWFSIHILEQFLSFLVIRCSSHGILKREWNEYKNWLETEMMRISIKEIVWMVLKYCRWLNGLFSLWNIVLRFRIRTLQFLVFFSFVVMRWLLCVIRCVFFQRELYSEF